MEQEQKIDASTEELLIKSPYDVIKEWAEKKLRFVGDKVYQFAALQPVSLVAPSIPSGEYPLKTNMHLLLIAPSGSGKTTAAKMLKDISVNPFEFQDITGAFMASQLSGKDAATLICTDVESIFKDMDLIKIMEGALGEEHTVNRFNMRSSVSVDTNCVFFGVGLPYSLKKNIQFGFIQRTIPIVLFHTKEEQLEIGRYRNKGMFNTEFKLSFADIKGYYKKIYDVQKGFNDDFKRIDGYTVPEQFKNEIERTWRDLMELPFPEDHYLNRELNSIYKYLCTSAILNMFNREIVQHKHPTLGMQRFIVPTEHDLKLAKSLFKMEIGTKYHILKLNQMATDTKRQDILNFYDRVKGDDRLTYEYKQIARIFTEQRLGKKFDGKEQ